VDARKHFPPALLCHGASSPVLKREVPWKQKLFRQGLENSMQFMPYILPSHFGRVEFSIWVGAAEVSNSAPQIPVVESPTAALGKHISPLVSPWGLQPGTPGCSSPELRAATCSPSPEPPWASFAGTFSWWLHSPSPQAALQVSGSWTKARHTQSQSSR